MCSCSTKTDCWDELISGAQIAADCKMNRCELLLFASTSSSLFSLSHTVTYYFCDLSPYILSPHMRTLPYLAPLHMYYLLEATGAKSLAWCDVNGKNKTKTLLSYWHMTASSLSRFPTCMHTPTNPHSLPTKANRLRTSHKHTHTHTHSITGLLRQTVARAGMSLVRRVSLWGLFIWNYMRDSYVVWTKIPTLANLFIC